MHPSISPLETTEGLSELIQGARGRSQAGHGEGTTEVQVPAETHS